MKYQSFIKELQNRSNPLEINHITWWLMRYEIEFHNAINSTTCRKWSKCFNTNEKPFPCACSTREQDCIFIETYFKLNNIVTLHKLDQHFKELVKQYEIIKNNKEEIKLWVNNLKKLGNNLFFETKIIISLCTEPYEKMILQLDEKEFEGIIEFQQLYFQTIN